MNLCVSSMWTSPWLHECYRGVEQHWEIAVFSAFGVATSRSAGAWRGKWRDTHTHTSLVGLPTSPNPSSHKCKKHSCSKSEAVARTHAHPASTPTPQGASS